MESQIANQRPTDDKGRPEITASKNETPPAALQRAIHITPSIASSTAAVHSTSSHDFYSQVFGTAPLQTASSVASNSPIIMADDATNNNDEIHAAYLYSEAGPQTKGLIAQCTHCGQRTRKNVTRQRSHILRGCPVLHPMQNDAESLQRRGQRQRIPTLALVPDVITDTMVPKAKQNTPVSVSSSIAELSRPTLLLASSLSKTSSSNSYSSQQYQVRVGSTPEMPFQSPYPDIPSGGNHPLSTYHRSSVAHPDSRTRVSPASSMALLAVGSRPRPWMLHHEARAANDFPQPSITPFVIKIESETYDQSLRTPSEPTLNIQSTPHATPLASIEAEYDDEDSEDQYSGESESGSDAESNRGSDNDSDSPPDDDDDDDDDEDEETLPFPDDEDDVDGGDDGNDTDGGVDDSALDTARNRAADGCFGPGARHKRQRLYKRGKRGPKKHADPSPEFTALQNEAMRVFIDEQDNPKAMRLVQQAIGVNPEFYSAHALLSEIYFAQGEDQLAVNALYFGAYSAPRDADIWQGVADACLRLKTIDRETALRQALNCFRRILDIDENHHDALFQRAAIYAEMGNRGRALREYDSLLKIMPYNTSIMRQKAPLLEQIGNVDKAIELFEASIAHGKGTGNGAEDEFSWPDILVYTDIIARTGQIEEAIMRLKRLSRWLVDREMEDFWDEVVNDDREWDSEHEPRRVEAEGFHPNLFPEELYGQALPFELRVKLGLYRLTQGLESRFEAFGHFEWLTPDNQAQGAPVHSHPELFFDVAKALKDVKEHEEALRYYEALLATEAYLDVSFWLQIAATSFACGKSEQAKECYEAAKAADRNCVEARTQLGMLYARLGDKPKALENAEAAVEMATRGIRKMDRRTYEKKNQKASRKAAERVLKIARRLERPRKPRRRTLGPAQIKRKQSAIDRKAQRLANTIEKQTHVYERRVVKKKKTSEQDNNMRTARVQQLYSQLTDLRPAMRSGDPQARLAWLNFAQQMIEDFCSTDALFPSERHQKFAPYQSEASKIVEVATAEGSEDANATRVRLYDEDYRGIPFSSWLDIFLETSLLHAKSGTQWKDACYALLRSAYNCTVWHSDSAAMLQIYTCYFACALELHDEHTLLFTVGRWFVKEYRFCTDTYRLFAALNLFYTDVDGGKPTADKTEYRNPNTQKFMLRQMSAMAARLPEDYNEHGEDGPVPAFMRTILAPEPNGVQEDEDMEDFADDFKPKEMDVVLLCLYGHIIYAGDTFVSALNYFYRALTLDERNPMVLFSIALCYAHELAKRGTEDRHMHVLNGMAVFDEYAAARLEQASGGGDTAVTVAQREISFNRSRLWQMLGLSDLALREYQKVLEPTQSDDLAITGEQWSMEAAFAASNLYASNGDPAMAKYVTEKWLVIE